MASGSYDKLNILRFTSNPYQRKLESSSIYDAVERRTLSEDLYLQWLLANQSINKFLLGKINGSNNYPRRYCKSLELLDLDLRNIVSTKIAIPYLREVSPDHLIAMEYIYLASAKFGLKLYTYLEQHLQRVTKHYLIQLSRDYENSNLFINHLKKHDLDMDEKTWIKEVRKIWSFILDVYHQQDLLDENGNHLGDKSIRGFSK